MSCPLLRVAGMLTQLVLAWPSWPPHPLPCLPCATLNRKAAQASVPYQVPLLHDGPQDSKGEDAPPNKQMGENAP